MQWASSLGSRLWGAVHRPEYVYHPAQLYRRLLVRQLVARDAVTFAWGLPVSVDPNCRIGRDIANVGVFDKIVPEAICRLLDPGENAADAGANIGQNTSI